MIEKWDETKRGFDYDEFTFHTSKSGKCCYHRINGKKSGELLERLKHSKYFKGKHKFNKFEYSGVCP